ncbi:DUF6220 domain-containing protein [Lutibaculum baratangense]|uniref:Uncharacterized protein n=1 Tax=Lutibaculum baratangense AMV1 TaxID=631454 RepID=V4RNL0_9HYPH|nr:DUF6220 domain-containing protein [Lutibaculum baratangense]ESR24790.1 hypothetical protein N177_2113 [Lutibaculum baratangense AMV1]
MSGAIARPRATGSRLAFRTAATAVPIMITGQFFLIGLAIFADAAAFDLHRALGGLVAVPVAASVALAFLLAELRPMRRGAATLLALYVTQILWLELGEATGLGTVQALHALNAVFLMGASVSLAERAGR